MLFHMLMHAIHILKEAYVTQLIQLVMSNRLIIHPPSRICKVRLRGCHCRDTGTREADLGCGDEFINHILRTFLLTLSQKLQNHILIILIQVMNRVCIIPENSKIRCCRL